MAGWGKWWKKMALACGLAGAATSAYAQVPPGMPYPMPGGPGPNPGEPLGVPVQYAPQVPGPGGPYGPGFAPGGPSGPASGEKHSFILDGSPGAFAAQELAIEPPEWYCFTFRADFLNWRLGSPNFSAPLATTSTNPNAATDFGALDQPSTVLLFGPGRVGLDMQQGGRVAAGFGLLPIPIEVRGMWLNQEPQNLFSSASTGAAGTQVVSRPIFDPNLNQETVLTAGFPGLFGGSLNVTLDQSYWNIDTILLLPVGATDVLAVDFLLGYRHAQFSEELNIVNNVFSVAGGPGISFGGNVFDSTFNATALDIFRTRNTFNGGVLGLRSSINLHHRLALTTDMRLALGAANQQISISGSSSLFDGSAALRGPLQTLPGGVLALPSNSGDRSTQKFTVIPEIGVTASFRLTRWLKLFAGYDIFYWTSIIRPSNQLNTIVDRRQIPLDGLFQPNFTGTAPLPPDNRSDFYGYGYSFGFELSW